MDVAHGVESVEPDSESDRSRAWLVLLVVAVVILHARTASDGLYLDDHHHVRSWTFDEVVGTFHGPFDPLGLEPVYFRPLVAVSFALDWLVWGWSPMGFHITNIALHVVASCLSFALLVRLGTRPGIAFVGALFFAAIPANVAGVAYISERSDVMVLIFTISGLLALSRFAVHHQTRWLVLLNMAYIAAILSKEVGIAMIATTVLVWWYLHLPERQALPRHVVAHWRQEVDAACRPLIDRRGWPDWARVIAPMSAIAVATFAYRAAVLPTGALSERYSGTNPVTGLASAVVHTFLMVPWELRAIGAPLLALLAVFALACSPTSEGWRLVALGALWVVATCIPLAWLGQVEPRLLYVAQVGVAMTLAGLLHAVSDAAQTRTNWSRTVVAGSAAALLLGLSAATVIGTVQAQNEFAVGSAKMLNADLQIWTDTPDRRDKWPEHWMPAIRERLLAAGLITEDGEPTEPAGG